jgi:hypothetical protein
MEKKYEKWLNCLKKWLNCLKIKKKKWRKSQGLAQGPETIKKVIKLPKKVTKLQKSEENLRALICFHVLRSSL